MKRLLSLAAMLLVCCVTLFAQQALWGGAAVVSPDIHDDNTVTFRLKAPKAVRVQITGDFLPPQTIKTPRGDYDAPGIADLTEGKDGRLGIYYSRTIEAGTLWILLYCGRIENDGPEQCLHDSGCGYRDQCIYHRW